MNQSFGDDRIDDNKQKERQRAKSMRQERQEEVKEEKWYPGKYLKIWVTKIKTGKNTDVKKAAPLSQSGQLQQNPAESEENDELNAEEFHQLAQTHKRIS